MGGVSSSSPDSTWAAASRAKGMLGRSKSSSGVFGGLVEATAQPFHLGAVVRAFFRDNDVGASREDAAKAFTHPGGAADDVRARQIGVGFAQPGREADSAGNAVELGEGEAALGGDEVGANDAGDVPVQGLAAGVFEEAGGLAGVQDGGDPGRELAAGASPVDSIEGLLEGKEARAELFELIDLATA
jgi:hypothetical protein